MNICYITGVGTFTNENGQQKYQVHKLRIYNKSGQDIEVKLDKTARRILGFMFDFQELEEMTEDENGVQCTMYQLKDKS